MKVVGLMSGTSMDGIDAALLELPDEGAGGVSTDGFTPGVEATGGREAGCSDPWNAFSWKLVAFRSVAYSDVRRRRIRQAVDGRAGTEEICALHRDLGSWLGEAVHDLCDAAGLETSELDLVGSHGHTVWHAPPPDPRTRGASLQLGSAAVLAEAVGVPVVSDFRSADLAAGGHGAPLVPFADRLLFSVEERTRAIQNLGGMGNVTWLPPRGSNEELVAFDTGPGVALLDAAAEMATDGRLRFDRDGELAARGTADSALVDRLMEDPFFDRPPPRSTGRELFGDALVRSLARERGLEPGRPEEGWPDLLATLVDFTARSVEDAYRRWIIPRGVDEVFLTGGGARNPALAGAISRHLGSLPIRPAHELGADPDAREAVAFAVLAWTHVQRIPGNVPAATGARGHRILGSYTPGPGVDPERRAGA